MPLGLKRQARRLLLEEQRKEQQAMEEIQIAEQKILSLSKPLSPEEFEDVFLTVWERLGRRFSDKYGPRCRDLVLWSLEKPWKEVSLRTALGELRKEIGYGLSDEDTTVIARRRHLWILNDNDRIESAFANFRDKTSAYLMKNEPEEVKDFIKKLERRRKLGPKRFYLKYSRLQQPLGQEALVY